jgi:hypothetical protein
MKNNLQLVQSLETYKELEEVIKMKRFAGDSKGGGFSKEPPLAAGGISVESCCKGGLKHSKSVPYIFKTISFSHRGHRGHREK